MTLKPWLFQGSSIKSIDNLITNVEKAKQMKHAIKIFLARSSIIEIENIFKIIKSNRISIFFRKPLVNDFEMLQTYFQKDKKLFNSEEMEKKLEMLKDILNNVSRSIEKYLNP